MRNANVIDISQMHKNREVHYGVMYSSMFGLMHRVKVAGGLAETIRKAHPMAVVMESAKRDSAGDYTVYAMLPGNLHPIVKGPSHTPKKPKRKPVKGTKPRTKIPYKFEDVEVGDIVEWLHAIARKKHSCKIVTTANGGWLSSNCYGAKQWSPMPWQEAYILKPYKEPVKPKEEEVYQIGDRFEISDGYQVVLCRVQTLKAQLIICDGREAWNRWSDRVMTVSYDSTVKARDLLEIVSLTYRSIKKI